MICEVVKKQWLTQSVCDMTVLCPKMAKNAAPGQFLHILCGGDSYLRRPISICDVIGNRLLRFVFFVKGKGTEAISMKNPGEFLDILGPLGHGFSVSGPAEPPPLLIGGGIGVFPLLYLAKKLGSKASAVLGFQNKEAALLADEFSKVCQNVFLSTDDGSAGFHGFVTDILKNIVDSNPVSAIYTCGPKAMMKQVSVIAAQKGIPVQVSLEERMGCGVGACMTCTCGIAGGRKRVCKDGPVFDGTEVDWDD